MGEDDASEKQDTMTKPDDEYALYLVMDALKRLEAADQMRVLNTAAVFYGASLSNPRRA